MPRPAAQGGVGELLDILGRGGAQWADLRFGAPTLLDPLGVARVGQDAGRAGDDDELGLPGRVGVVLE